MGKFVQMVKPVSMEMDFFLLEIFKKFGQERNWDASTDASSSETPGESESEKSPSESCTEY
jgi:hypothetical protein